jgi:hypothetical protein
MKVTITLTSSGTESGPFYDLYSSIDGIIFVNKFESEVARSQLVAGYDTIVPSGTIKVRIQSVGYGGEGCTDYIDVDVDLIPIIVPEPPTTLSPLYIGQTYQGGVIIEVSYDYSYGTILSTNNIGGYTSIGSYSWGDAVLAARAFESGGYVDWSLPTHKQLSSMYYHRASLPGVNFAPYWYWASEEYSVYGIALHMGTGTQGAYQWYKNNSLRALAVRRFFRV